MTLIAIGDIKIKAEVDKTVGVEIGKSKWPIVRRLVPTHHYQKESKSWCVCFLYEHTLYLLRYVARYFFIFQSKIK